MEGGRVLPKYITSVKASQSQPRSKGGCDDFNGQIHLAGREPVTVCMGHWEGISVTQSRG